MVYVEDLRERPSFQFETILQECPLEVPHTLFPTRHTVMERIQRTGCQGVDTRTDITRMVTMVQKCGDPQIVICTDKEGLLVIDIVRDAHQTVSLTCFEETDECLHEGTKLFLPEDRVDGSQHKRAVVKPPAQFPHAVHGTGCGLHDQPQRQSISLLYGKEVFLHLSHLLVTDDSHFRSCLSLEDSQQSVDQLFTVHLDQRLRYRIAFFCQPRAFARGYHCIFHPVSLRVCLNNSAKVIIYYEKPKHFNIFYRLLFHSQPVDVNIARANFALIELLNPTFQGDVTRTAQLTIDGDTAFSEVGLNISGTLQ